MAEAVVDLPKLHLTVRVPFAHGPRMWVFLRLMWLATLIGPHKVSVEIDTIS